MVLIDIFLDFFMYFGRFCEKFSKSGIFIDFLYQIRYICHVFKRNFKKKGAIMRFFIFLKKSFIVIFAFNGAWANTQAQSADALTTSGIAAQTNQTAQEKLSAWLIANNFVDYRSKEALLREAISQGDFEIANLLIALENESERKQKLLAVYLAENNLDSKESKEALLFKAIEIGDIEIARLLLGLGVDVHARKFRNSTPLHWIAEAGNMREDLRLEIANLLLGFGANVRLTDKMGRPPLHWAAENGFFKMAELLISRGANVNVASNIGRTALHLTITFLDDSFAEKPEEKIKNLIKTAAVLMNNGANIHAQDHGGQTPHNLINGIHNAERRSLLHYISDQGDDRRALRNRILNDESLEDMRACRTAIRGA